MKILFRAEAIFQGFDKESDELKKIDGIWYAIGYEMLNNSNNKYYISGADDLTPIQAKYETRAINFENILDSNKDKIFISLSEDGTGGDKVRYKDYEDIYTMVFEDFTPKAKHTTNIDNMGYKYNPRLEIVGIQK